MEEGLKKTISNTINERLSSPLWGYIFFSWIGFNWQNIAKLFMSKKSVEDRIIEITSQDWMFFHYILAPVLLGCILAIASPYIHQYLSLTHKLANKKKRESDKDKIIEKYDDEIVIAEKKVAAEKAEELAKEKEKTKVVQEQEKQKREQLDTQTLESEIKQLEKKHKDLGIIIRDLDKKREDIREESEIWKNRSLKVINTISGYSELSDSRSLNSLKNELRSMFSEEDFEISGYALEHQRLIQLKIDKSIMNAMEITQEINRLYKKELNNGEVRDATKINDMDSLINNLLSTLKNIKKVKYITN